MLPVRSYEFHCSDDTKLFAACDNKLWFDLIWLSSFALSLSPSPPTHKAGNHLDYIFTRNCSTSNLTVTPLHVSDHFFISYSLPLSQTDNPTTSTDSVPVRRNIRSLSPASLASSVLSALPSTDSFSLMHPNSATDILLSTLSSSLDSLCPLTSRQVSKSSPAPWLSDSVRADRATMRASERKWGKSKHQDDLLTYQSLLSSFSASISTAKSTFYQTTIQSSFSNPKKLFSIFSNLHDPPSPPPPFSLLLSCSFLLSYEKSCSLLVQQVFIKEQWKTMQNQGKHNYDMKATS